MLPLVHALIILTLLAISEEASVAPPSAPLPGVHATVAAAPPLLPLPGINAAYPVGEGSSGGGAGGSGPFVAYLGAQPSLSACTSAAAAWRNGSAPAAAQRCRSSSWLRAPANASFAGGCYCRTDARWLPVPSPGVDSARLLWPCAGAADCSHNGACGAGGACACDAAWGGPACAELRLLPVDAAAPGLRLTNSTGHNVSTWGAPMLLDEATGRWHAWPSEMVNGCGINSWTSNSHIVHATAPAPGGPWARAEEVAPVFAHEPGVVRGPAGEWVMVFSAWALPPDAPRCTDCADGQTLNHPSHNGCGANASHAFRTLLSVAQAPDGPWGPPIDITKLDAPFDWNTAITILPNRSAVAVLRALFTWHAEQYDAAATWRPVGGSPQGPPMPDANVEDPFIYRDQRGVFHAVVHAMDVADDQRFCGGHAFSEDGANWTYTGFAWSNAANFSDGSWQTFSRRERPHLLFAADGVTPIALSTGVEYGGGDAVFTLVQPVATAAE